MAHSPLTPVFLGLRTGLHVLFVALVVLVIGRALTDEVQSRAATVLLALLLLVTYAVGALLPRSTGGRHIRSIVWLLALSAEWLTLVWLIPEGAYLVFPLFFLYVHVLRRQWGIVAVMVATILAILALGMHRGWSIGGTVGPLVGAAVAVVVGLGYRALAHEAAQQQALTAELLTTQDVLAAAEHESGVLAERARLARDIHDTVAQGLSSIQMLLHAAERLDDGRPGIEHIRLARETAAANLADTRRFIRELAPPELDDHGIGAALQRIAGTVRRTDGLEVDVRVAEPILAPMHVQTALLRIAQGALANVVQHADARSVQISLDQDARHVRLCVADDGRGFDAANLATLDAGGQSDSFGLTATRERVEQLGGTLTVASSPGNGTTLTVELEVDQR